MTTYAELTTQILNYTETSTDVLSSTITDDFIEHTENRILREVDLDVFKSHQYWCEFDNLLIYHLLLPLSSDNTIVDAQLFVSGACLTYK